MIYKQAFKKGFRPDPVMTVTKWADEYRYLPSASSKESGKYRTSRVPYLREVMQELSPSSPTQKVILVKPTQIGATEAANCFLMCVAHLFPGPCLIAFPTDAIAKKHSKKKLTPSINMMPCLKGIIKEVKSRDSGNTILEKDFPGGSWTLTGSNSPTSARHDSIRYLVLDDYDGFVPDIGGEGDPASLFSKRTDSFGSKRKIFINSTPTIAGISVIEKEFKVSSQGLYHVPCPHCKEYQALEWGGKGYGFGIKFTHDEDNQILRVWYVCKHCKKRIKESDKEKMLAHGRYVHKYPNRLIRGFKINSLYSPLGWVSWSQIAKEFLDIDKSKEKLKVFVNTRLAETFEEIGDQPEWPSLKARAEPYDILTMPEGGMILTAGVDVQDDRLVVVVRAWGRHEESWLVYYGELWGDPDKPEAWAQLDKLLLMNISDYHIISCAVDTGGHRTQAVYNYCRFRAPQVIAIKGASQPGKPIIGRPTKQDVTWNGEKISNGVELWPVGSDVGKSTIYSRLRQVEPGAKTYHWPIGLPDEYYLQLTAERQITKYINGYPKLEWIKVRERNDALDAENYAYSAAIRAGMALYDWDKIEDGISSRRPADPAKKKAVVRKPVRSSWMS